MIILLCLAAWALLGLASYFLCRMEWYNKFSTFNGCPGEATAIMHMVAGPLGFIVYLMIREY